MADSWNALLCGLSGIVFSVSSIYTLVMHNYYTSLLNTPHITLRKLHKHIGKYLNSKIFLYGRAFALPSLQVNEKQSLTSDIFSNVIYSYYTNRTEDIKGKTIDSASQTKFCNFNLFDLGGRSLKVETSSYTDFQGYRVHKASGTLNANWRGMLNALIRLLNSKHENTDEKDVACKYQ